MNKYLKIGLVIVGILVIVILFTKHIRDEENFKDLKKAIKEQTQEVKILSNNNLEMKDRIVGRETAEILYKNQIDSLAKLLKVKPKSIKEYVSVNSEVKADVKAKNDTFINSKTKIIDSLVLSYNDEWIDIKGTVQKTGSRLQISGRDTILLTHIEKGNNIIVSARNSNKYIHLTGASSLTITQPKPSVVQIRPFVGIGYDPLSKKLGPTIGAGITVDLGRVLKSIF